MVLVQESVAWVESPQEHFPPLPNCQAILTTQKLIISVEHVAPDILPTYIKRYLTIPWNTILQITQTSIDQKKNSEHVLRIRLKLKDHREIDLNFAENPGEFIQELHKRQKPLDPFADIFAYYYFNNHITQIEFDKSWKVYDFQTEFKR